MFTAKKKTVVRSFKIKPVRAIHFRMLLLQNQKHKIRTDLYLIVFVDFVLHEQHLSRFVEFLDCIDVISLQLRKFTFQI